MKMEDLIREDFCLKVKFEKLSDNLGGLVVTQSGKRQAALYALGKIYADKPVVLTTIKAACEIAKRDMVNLNQLGEIVEGDECFEFSQSDGKIVFKMEGRPPTISALLAYAFTKYEILKETFEYSLNFFESAVARTKDRMKNMNEKFKKTADEKEDISDFNINISFDNLTEKSAGVACEIQGREKSMLYGLCKVFEDKSQILDLFRSALLFSKIPLPAQFIPKLCEGKEKLKFESNGSNITFELVGNPKQRITFLVFVFQNVKDFKKLIEKAIEIYISASESSASESIDFEGLAADYSDEINSIIKDYQKENGGE